MTGWKIPETGLLGWLMRYAPELACLNHAILVGCVEIRQPNVDYTTDADNFGREQHKNEIGAMWFEPTRSLLPAIPVVYKMEKETYEEERPKCPHCGLDLDEHDSAEFCPPGTEEFGGRR